jgi:hypothetical protein
LQPFHSQNLERLGRNLMCFQIWVLFQHISIELEKMGTWGCWGLWGCWGPAGFFGPPIPVTGVDVRLGTDKNLVALMF